MKEFKEEMVSVKQTTLVKTVCDFCGKEIVGEEEYQYMEVLVDDTRISYYDVVARLAVKTGWPGTGTLHNFDLDMCVKCFDTLLIKKANRNCHVEMDE